MKAARYLASTSLWCILVLISWTQVSLGGILPDRFGVVTPEDPFIYIGQNLSLLCNITTNHSYAVSDHMTFEKENVPLDKKYIKNLNSKVICLDLPIRSLQDEGNYICMLRGSEVLFLGVQHIRVEYPLQAIQSVDCRVLGWETMFCNWTAIPYHHQNVIKSVLYYRTEYPRVLGDSEWRPCVNSSINSCFWPQGEFMFEFNISLVLVTLNTVTHDLVKSQQFNITPKYHIEPHRVSGVKVTHVNSSCVGVDWGAGLLEENQCIYRVQFTSQWEQQTQESRTDDNQTTRCELIPFTNYTLSVTCRLVESVGAESGQLPGYWSRPTVVTVTTHQMAPVMVPESCTGCFTFTDNGEIIIYFQTLKAQDWYGTQTEYIIRVINMATGITQNVSRPPSSNSFSFPEENSTLAVQIYTKNRVGTSKRFTSFHIPEKHMAPHPPDIVIEFVEQTAMYDRYHLTWVTSSSLLDAGAANYTVYWCQQSQDKIFWKEMAFDKRDIYIQIPREAHSIYLIGVSIEQIDLSGDVISSGIHWQPCVYNANKGPQPPQNVHFLDHQPENSLLLAWQLPSCALTSPVSHLILTYCKVSDIGVGEECSQSPVVEELSSNTESYLIDNLEHGASYKVYLQSVSNKQTGPRSNQILHKVTSADSSEKANYLYITISLIVSISIFLLVAILCKKVKCQKYQPTYPQCKEELELKGDCRIKILSEHERMLPDNSEQHEPTSPTPQNVEAELKELEDSGNHSTNRLHEDRKQSMSSNTESLAILQTTDLSPNSELHTLNSPILFQSTDPDSSSSVIPDINRRPNLISNSFSYTELQHLPQSISQVNDTDLCNSKLTRVNRQMRAYTASSYSQFSCNNDLSSSEDFLRNQDLENEFDNFDITQNRGRKPTNQMLNTASSSECRAPEVKTTEYVSIDSYSKMAYLDHI